MGMSERRMVNNSVLNFLSAVRKRALYPIEWLRQYYSHVLEREVSTRQTWLLINAQTAFVFAAFPVNGPFLLRVACCAWFAHAVWRCRKAF